MGKRVLLADDSRVMRKILVRSLTASGMTETIEASNGVEALSLFEPGKFDLVLTDWNMPLKCGLDVIREIRAQDKVVPILMVTTEGEQRQILKAINAGVSGYLCKPFTADQLLAKLEEVNPGQGRCN